MLLVGLVNLSEAAVLRGKLAEAMQKGGFALHKWKSDDEEVWKSLIEERKDDNEETFVKQSLNERECQIEVLGIKWNPKSDVMAAELSQVVEETDISQNMTKRELLSGLSRIYDALGVVGPITIVTLKIFEDVCR